MNQSRHAEFISASPGDQIMDNFKTKPVDLLVAIIKAKFVSPIGTALWVLKPKLCV